MDMIRNLNIMINVDVYHMVIVIIFPVILSLIKKKNISCYTLKVCPEENPPCSPD